MEKQHDCEMSQIMNIPWLQKLKLDILPVAGISDISSDSSFLPLLLDKDFITTHPNIYPKSTRKHTFRKWMGWEGCFALISYHGGSIVALNGLALYLHISLSVCVPMKLGWGVWHLFLPENYINASVDNTQALFTR